ncbi:hypothetical protein V1264_010695 [Littorina saxatilis]|uniref:Uncharacterized protein n=1 Tax=Littorina saxatilis TaxID=31220 RepID=A0AAN9AQ60_9CAEN
MARLMILLVVVAVSLSAVLSCPPNEAAMQSEMEVCTAGMASAGQTKEGLCSAVTDLLKCIDTALTGCEGVPYVEAERGSIDAGMQNLRALQQQMGCA